MANQRICPSCGSEIKQGSDYCLMCGEEYDASRPVQSKNEEPETGTNMSSERVHSYTLNLLRQKRRRGIVIAVCIILLAAMGIYSYSSAKRLNSFKLEYARIQNENENLLRVNENLNASNESLSEERAELASRLDEMLGDGNGLLKLEILDTVVEFQSRCGSDNIRYADYGADRSIVFMREGESAELLLHFDHTDSLLYWALEKEGIVLPEWGSAWAGTSCPLTLNGIAPGCCEIMFGSDYSDDVFYVLCVVLPR